jgi:hypothetical protein
MMEIDLNELEQGQPHWLLGRKRKQKAAPPAGREATSEDAKEKAIRLAKGKLADHAVNQEPLTRAEIRDCLLIVGFTPEELDHAPPGLIRCPYTGKPLW